MLINIIMLPASMNYYKKMNAMGRNQKMRLSAQPTNGSTFTSSSSTIEITIPCSQPGLFADLRNGYFMCNIANGDGTNSHLLYGKVGTLGLIKKVRCETSSNTKFSEVENFNVLASMKLAESVDTDWLMGQGRVMFGTSNSSIAGDEIASGGNITRVVPFTLSGLSSETYVPLFGRENIKLQFELESALTGTIGTNATATATDLTITSVNFYYDAYKLEDNEYKNLLDDTGGIFRISESDWLHQSEIIPAGSTNQIINIGFSKRKMKNLYFCLRTNSNLVVANVCSVTSRNQGAITKYSLKYNGSIIGQNAVNCQDPTGVDFINQGEAMAELMKGSGGLLNLHSNILGFEVNNFGRKEGAGTADNTCGSFFGKISLENGFQTDEALSGLEILNGNLQLDITKLASAGDQRLDIFVEYASEYVLDMANSGGVWEVYS